ncbi:MAG: class I SAM-dependent methyltransferase, partial [Pseudomonadota bacterium]
MTTNAVFWNKAARGYAKRPVADEAAYAHTLDRTRSYLKATDKVLEAGCGTGTTALKLADAAGEIVATDVASEMIAIAREKGKDAAKVRFEVADETLKPFDADTFDAVLAFNLIHLVPNPPNALRRFHELHHADDRLQHDTSPQAGCFRDEEP